jgi:hypothetical protein
MLRNTFLALPFAVLLNGCAYIDAIGQKFISLTNPVAMSGLVIGIEPPEDPEFQDILEQSEIVLGTSVSLIVANAAGAADLESAVVRDAKVTILEEDVAIRLERNTGAYMITPDQGLAWSPGTKWTFNVDLPDRPNPGKVEVKLTKPIRANLPSTVSLGEKLVFNLKGQQFDYAVAAIFDLDGQLVYDSKPTTVKQIVELLTRTEPVERLVIPKRAFPEEGLFLMGIAGLNETDDEDLTDLNSALSKFFFGQMKLLPVAVGSPIAANALLLGTASPPPELELAVGAAGYGAGTSLTLSAVDLTKLGDPILDAVVELEGIEAFDEEDSGVYTIPLNEGPVYQPGAEWTLQLTHPDFESPSLLRQVMPGAPDPNLPAQHPVNQPLTIDIGPEYTAAIVVVLGENGEVLYSNEVDPNDAISAFLDEENDAEPVTIPGTVFDNIGGVRAIGVAGLARADSEEFDHVLKDFSMMLAGQMAFHPLFIGP